MVRRPSRRPGHLRELGTPGGLHRRDRHRRGTGQLRGDRGPAAETGHGKRGAWLCGVCLGATTMSLHHKLCHILGGTFDLPHAETHTVLPPYVAAFNLPAAPAAGQALSRALAADDVPGHLARTSVELGAPRCLADIGLTPDDVDEVIVQAVDRPYANPRPVTSDALRFLLTAALNGALAP
ncbi:iron-containing alcohol dehydrogenase [Streptomyces sp. NPDC102476]|uniref:iron-containing alcohol dehydrogenase n=1 Tax=Streptomyces sp. NPDC102476 TaxID=3366181 RepID=UPI0037FEAFB7